MITVYLFYPFLQPQYWPYWVTTAFALAVLVNSRRYPWLFGALGGFLFGQMVATLVFPLWDLNTRFLLSAVLGAVFGLLTLAAVRPLVVLASFFGVGDLAYTLCAMFGIGSPWNLIVYTVAGAIAVAALFMRQSDRGFDRALIVNSALAVAGALIVTLNGWIVYFNAWNGWSAVIIGAIAVVVGIIHQFRQLPPATAAQPTAGVPQPAN
jgi:hypothetical protein